MWNSVGYGSVLYMSVLAGIDSSLYEAAEIDGAGTIKIFLTIMIPVIKPIMATVAIFSAVNQWNAFQDTLLLMTDTKLYPLQFILYQYFESGKLLKGTGKQFCKLRRYGSCFCNSTDSDERAYDCYDFSCCTNHVCIPDFPAIFCKGYYGRSS